MGTSEAGEDRAMVRGNQSKDESRAALPTHSEVSVTNGASQYEAGFAPGPATTAEFYKHNSSIPARLMEVLHPTLETMSHLYATLEAQLAANRTENKQLHEELKAARSRLADCEKNTASVYNENQILHDKLQRTWQEHADIDRKLSSRASSCLRAVQRVCSSRVDSDKLYVENQGIYAELQSARRYNMSLEKEVTTQQETVFHLRKKLEISQRQIEQLEKAYAAKHERCNRLKMKLEAANFQKEELKQMLSKQPQQQPAAIDSEKQHSPSQQHDAQSNSHHDQTVQHASATPQPDGLGHQHTADGLVIIASNQKTSQEAEPKITLQSQTMQRARLPPRSPEIQPIEEPKSQTENGDARGMRSQSMPGPVNDENSRAYSQPRRSLTGPAAQGSHSAVLSTPGPARPTTSQTDAPNKQSITPGGDGNAGKAASLETLSGVQQPRVAAPGLVTSIQPNVLATRPPLPATHRATSVPVVPRSQIQLPQAKVVHGVRGTDDTTRGKLVSAMQNGSTLPTRQVMVLPRRQDTLSAARMQQQPAAAVQKQSPTQLLPKMQDTPFAAQAQQQTAIEMPKQLKTRSRAQHDVLPTAQMQQRKAMIFDNQAQARQAMKPHATPFATAMQQQAAVILRQQPVPTAALKSIRVPSEHVPTQSQQSAVGARRLHPMQASTATSRQAQQAYGSKSVDAVARVRMDGPHQHDKK